MFKTTEYFEYTRDRQDRRDIRDEWIEAAIREPVREVIQHDGRIQRWTYVESMNHYLRVILMEDGETVHNAFFDRRFRR